MTQYIFPTLREYQKETLEKIQASPKKLIVIQQPTGGGKSFYPEQLAAWGKKVLTSVGAKSLQVQYNLTPLYGKGNYPCGLETAPLPLFKESQHNADDCHIKDRKLCFDTCPYPLAKQEFLASDGSVTNYHKFLSDKPLIEEANPSFLFLDEAHLLSDIVLDYAGLSFKWKNKQLKLYSPGHFAFNLPQPLMYSQALEWLQKLLSNMNNTRPLPPHRGGSLYDFRWHKNTLRKVATTLSFMRSVPESWYIEADKEGLLIKPKTARYNFINLFDKAPKIILMSATINHHTLRELGIKDYEFIKVPNLWPVPLRPIYDLKCPKMGYNSTDSDKDLQAEIIAHSLSQRPTEHTGLIHVTSKAMARDLAYRLGKYTERRLFVPNENDSTEVIYEQWMSIKNDGTQIIYWGMWEGWDCGKDHIVHIAKIPFTSIQFERDENGKLKKSRNSKSIPKGFDTHRHLYDYNASMSRVADKLQQGLGRIRRGNQEDYGPNKFVAIADSNYKRILEFLPKDLGIIS